MCGANFGAVSALGYIGWGSFTHSAAEAASHGHVRGQLQCWFSIGLHRQCWFSIGLQNLGQIKAKPNVKATHKGGFFCGLTLMRVKFLKRANKTNREKPLKALTLEACNIK
jgi:hypothetical protein